MQAAPALREDVFAAGQLLMSTPILRFPRGALCLLLSEFFLVGLKLRSSCAENALSLPELLPITRHIVQLASKRRVLRVEFRSVGCLIGFLPAEGVGVVQQLRLPGIQVSP